MNITSKGCSMEPSSSTRRILSTEGLSLREFQKRVARYFYETGAEFDKIKCDSFQQILELIQGQEAYTIPSCDELNGWILQECVQEMQAHSGDIKRSWESTGCSILLDGWKGAEGRNIINILVSCPKGTIYLRSENISSFNSGALQVLFEEVLIDVGVENVVQIVSHSTSPMMMQVGKNLVDKYQTFFWTVSGSCCIDLMLEKFSRMDLVGDVLERSKKITRFFHGHASVLKLLQDQTSLRGLVEPSKIRSIVPFLTIQNMVFERAPLEKLFQSSAWKSSNWASTEEGKLVARLVMEQSFWERAILVVKAVLPLVKVLEWMNGDDDHLGNIYETIDQAKETIREQLKDTTTNHMPFWEIIDEIWNENLHSPLHAAGYFLNPFLFYTADFSSHPEVTTGLFCCSVRMIEDHRALVEFSKQLEEYQRASGAFGLGSSDLSNTSPVTWWLKYGEEYPELQRFAIRILSQTCSGASKYQLKRSMAEKLFSEERSPLEQKRQTDLAFVHYNIHLQNFKPNVPDKISIHEMDRFIKDWIVDTEHAASPSGGPTWMDLD